MGRAAPVLAAAPVTPHAGPRARNLAALVLKKYAIVLVLIAFIALFSAMTPYFFTVSNLTNVFVQQSYVIIAAVGLAFVMIAGGVDLSIGYQMSVVGVFTAIMMTSAGLPVIVSVLLGLALGVVLGLVNGIATVALNVHPLIVTLGTMTVFQGLSYIISNQSAILNLPSSFKAIGQGYLGPVPIGVIVMVVVVATGSFVLNRTYFGRYVYALGSNEEAAHLAGINVVRMKLIIFAVCGLFVAMAAMVLFGRTGSAVSSTGPGTEFTAITAAVLGGISFKGGEGKMWGLVVGVFILGVLGNGMQLIGMNTYGQYIVKGLVLLLAVGFDTFQKSQMQKAAKAPAP